MLPEFSWDFRGKSIHCSAIRLTGRNIAHANFFLKPKSSRNRFEMSHQTFPQKKNLPDRIEPVYFFSFGNVSSIVRVHPHRKSCVVVRVRFAHVLYNKFEFLQNIITSKYLGSFVARYYYYYFLFFKGKSFFSHLYLFLLNS